MCYCTTDSITDVKFLCFDTGNMYPKSAFRSGIIAGLMKAGLKSFKRDFLKASKENYTNKLKATQYINILNVNV